tara:strand:- start:252 stop:389 length:138 start_codon:yes stop_codon:yes gene_type:complete
MAPIGQICLQKGKKLNILFGILLYVKLHCETEANMIFADMPRKAH